VKRPNAILKLAAVASSAVLVAGFVSYRAGAFDWAGATGSPTAESGPDPASDENAAVGNPSEPAGQPAVSPVTSPVMLSGSKSGIFIVPPSSTPPGGSTVGASPAIMGGSKTIAPLIPPASPSPTPPK
jgi:hypothetical protein